MNEQLTQIYGYLHGMWRYRWSALVVSWLVAIIGWPLVFSMPDQFSAKAVVYIDTSSVLKPLLKGLAPETDTSDELQVMARVLLSRDNLMSVVRETDMDLEAETSAEREEIVERLAGEISIKGGGTKKKWETKSNIYEISYQSNSANRAYQVVSNLLNTMIEDTLNSTRTDTVSAQKFLDSQIAVYEERLTLAEQKLAQFKKENVGFMPDERGGYYMRLQRAQDSVEATTSALRLAERRYSELNRQLKGENPILSSSGYLSANAKKIKEYQMQLDFLLNSYTDRHPDVRALRAIIEELQAAPETGEMVSGDISDDDSSNEFNPVYQEVKVELSKASVDVETLKIQLKEQNAYVKKLRSSIDVIPEVEANLAKLNRGYEVTRERYLDLVERRESAQLAQNAGQSASDITFRVIEPPIVPYQPSGPNRMLFLSVVLLVALMAGLAWSFLRFTLQPTFIDLTQISNATGLPVLGSVSLYLSPEHKRRRRMQLSSFVTATLLLVVVFGAVFILRDSGTALFASMAGK
ncbi:MAG: chain-length determining protein [Gammaproteobacteria bacterium]|nr:chain-length determining protein [Gammaproteobacteria bacterium]